MNTELIQALRIALFAGKQEDCLDLEQIELIENHIELLGRGMFGIITDIEFLPNET